MRIRLWWCRGRHAHHTYCHGVVQRCSGVRCTLGTFSNSNWAEGWGIHSMSEVWFLNGTLRPEPEQEQTAPAFRGEDHDQASGCGSSQEWCSWWRESRRREDTGLRSRYSLLQVNVAAPTVPAMGDWGRVMSKEAKFFCIVIVISNLWTHAWNIKYR
jgi:hypothetical protein